VAVYSVDYSGDWQHVEGVDNAQYTLPDATTPAYGSVKIRIGSFTRSDYAGGFGVSPRDVPITIWLETLDVEPRINGVLTVGGVDYTIIGVLSRRPDGAQMRLQCRREA